MSANRNSFLPQTLCLVLTKVPLACDVVFGMSLLFWDLFCPFLVSDLRNPMPELSLWLISGQQRYAVWQKKELPGRQNEQRRTRSSAGGRAWPVLLWTPRAKGQPAHGPCASRHWDAPPFALSVKWCKAIWWKRNKDWSLTQAAVNLFLLVC